MIAVGKSVGMVVGFNIGTAKGNGDDGGGIFVTITG